MIRRIFLDLDDVCNTLSMYFLSRIGCQVSPTNYADWPMLESNDLAFVANKLLGRERFDRRSFWTHFQRDDWASIPETPEFPWLLEQCERLVGRENILIATCSVDAPQCAAGKVDWIHAHFPKWMHRQFAITPRKWFFARSDALLIDDHPKNIRLFADNDGQVLLVPRPWNDLYGVSTGLYLVEQFGRLLSDQGGVFASCGKKSLTC
jgi:hypothetical protein